MNQSPATTQPLEGASSRNWIDYLTPEQRLQNLADILGKIAVRTVNRLETSHENNDSINV